MKGEGAKGRRITPKYQNGGFSVSGAQSIFSSLCVFFSLFRSFGVSCEIVMEGSGFLVHVLFLRYFGLILINFHDSSKNTYSVICLLVTHDWRLFLMAPVWVCLCQIGSLFASFAKSFGPQM